jgi:hypothetical protein
MPTTFVNGDPISNDGIQYLSIQPATGVPNASGPPTFTNGTLVRVNAPFANPYVYTDNSATPSTIRQYTMTVTDLLGNTSAPYVLQVVVPSIAPNPPTASYTLVNND